MKKLLIALIAIAVVTPVLAQEPPSEPPPAIGVAHNQVVRFLQLTEDQVIAWDELWQIHREAEQPLREEIAAVQAEINALFEAGEPDPAELGELVIVRHDLGVELAEVHRVYHEGFVALLTENQLNRLGFIARADKAQRVIPAFKVFELIRRR